MHPISAEFLMNELDQTIANITGAEAIQSNDRAPSVGMQLAHKRQQNGWSIDDVANQLKLAPRQIQAIEADDYAALPTIVMTRGYIRSYAKMLGLDPATILPSTVPVMAVKTQILGKQPTSATIFSESRLLLGGRNRIPYNWIFGAIVLVLIGILMAEFGGFSALRRPLETSAPVPAANHVGEGMASDAVTTPAPPASKSRAVVNAEGISAPLDAAIAVVKPQEANAVIPVAAAGANILKLTFKQNSWVEITRADKKILFSRVGKSGSTETFDIDQPVSIVIGNLAGVDVTLRGEAVDLKAGTKNNIARLNLK